MASTTTTVTTKMQVTIPEEVRKEFPLEPGSRLNWTVENNALVARRVRNVSELAGCLKSKIAFPGLEEEKKAVDELRTKDYSKKYGKK